MAAPTAPGDARPLAVARRKPQGKLAWLVPAVVTGGLAPMAVLLVRAVRKDLGSNPISEALNQLGLLALVLLVLSLAATPLKMVAGWTWPIRVRKSLGLLAFFYVCAHLLVYAVLDQGVALRAIAEDVLKRPFILAGVLGFVLLIPLAATSTASALKRLGAARWRRLHKLAYVAAILGVIHFLLRVKKDATEPMIYGALLLLLFAVRIGHALRERRARSQGLKP
jgi:methionine sulfoxide reductase heme-binding subunit